MMGAVAKQGMRLLGGGALAVLLAACAAGGAGNGGAGNGAASADSGIGGRGKAELKTASDQSSAQKRSVIRMQLAAGYYQRGQFDVALDEIKKAIEADPNNAAAYGIRGLIYSEMGELGLADDNFQRGLKLQPDNADLSNNYGNFLCQNGRGSQAMAHFERALNNRTYQSPDKALNNAGACAVKMKDYVAAERYLSEAVRLTPDAPLTNLNLLRVSYERRDYERAGFYLGRLGKISKMESQPADVLWIGIKVQRKLGDTAAASALGTYLRRSYASSPEFAAYQRGAFDE